MSLLSKTIALPLLTAIALSGCGDKPSSVSSEKTIQSESNTVENKALITAEVAKANSLFEDLFEASVARSPEFQTYLGRGTNTDKWDDLSDEFQQQSLALNKEALTRLGELNVDLLDDSTRLSHSLLTQSIENEIEDYKWRLYNYPVNQMFGTHSNVPDLLINQHRIQKISDAQAYIARLNGLPKYFDQLIDGLKQRAEAGIVPPKFVFPHIIRDSRNIITGAPFDDGESTTLLTDFSTKIDALANQTEDGISQEQKAELLAQANTALTNSVKPAYDKLVSYLIELSSTADTKDGVWKWRNGDDYYNVALARTTTTDLTADEIHKIGLDEVKRIHNEMRKIKDQVGFDGDLAKFMAHMRDSDQFYYPNTAEGKARYLNEATALIETMKGQLDGMFITKPVADIKVKAVEAFREQSAGKAFYNSPSEDGSRPGLYYANLYDMKAMPTYQMEALAYHEGIPGHHMQLAISQELKDIPTFRKYGNYTAYVEGWGLYSEFFPKEFGFYEDPYSDFGRLSMELWRACRLVVDTGIHSKKWTREQGIEYYTTNTPNAVSDAVKMVERHIVMPSQATAYKIGMLKIVELRENAKKQLGDKFDIRAYHDEVLKYGALPLNVLEENIQRWIDATKAS